MADKIFANTALEGLAPPPYNNGALSNNQQYRFFASVSGFVGDVFDGQTFRQSTLETSTSINGGEITYQIYNFTLNHETLRSLGNVSGSVRFTP
jgi:hypothetical protein